MKIRSLTSLYFKLTYQCPDCGNVFFDDKTPQLKMFRRCNEDVDKDLLRSSKGDKWQGFLHAEWVDEKPDWMPSNGYISAATLIKGRYYDDWDTLEKDYYQIFKELSEKNVLRSSSLKRNKNWIHLWQMKKYE
jgi:hypothetical protein